MLYFYDDGMENTYVPVFIYEYKQNNLDTIWGLVENVHDQRKQRAQKLQKFFSAGNYYEEDCVMFVGEMPSNYSIGKGFIRSFVSNTGSSEYFHRCLFDAGIYPTKQMPLITPLIHKYNTVDAEPLVYVIWAYLADLVAVLFTVI